MIKRSLIFAFCILLLLTLVPAQGEKMEISTIKESFEAGENITLKISLFDSQNNPLNADVNIILENPVKIQKIEKIISSNKFIDINLGEDAIAGEWTMVAKYKEVKTEKNFIVEINELVKFEINKDVLIISNIGNTRYTKTVYITIGDTRGTKQPILNPGEKINFRLVAPDGNYNIKITDGKTTLERSDVQLTGRAIGILDEMIGKRSPVTGINPEEGKDEAYSYLTQNKFVYVFILVIVGAVVLLTIERRFKRKVQEK